MRLTTPLLALTSIGAVAIGGCTPGGSGLASPAPSPAQVVTTTCQQAPFIQNGALRINADASYAGGDWRLTISVSPFSGQHVYPVAVHRKTALDVILRPGATAADQSRVASTLWSIPGVVNVDLFPAPSGAAAAPADLRVTVQASGDIDEVLPHLNNDPAVNPVLTASSFAFLSEPGVPADVVCQRDTSVPIHSVSGTVTPAADGHSGRFDIMTTSPFTGSRYHLSGQWNCPLAPPSIGVAGRNLGTPSATVTVQTSTLSFVPATVTVSVGQIVEWTVLSGGIPFNVSFAADQDVNSYPLTAGSTWQIRFTRPGTYPYSDTLHPGNSGTVIVTG